MPNITPDPADVVEEVLKRAKFDEEVIAQVKKFITANSPQAEQAMATDRAIRARHNEDFTKRFPDAARIGGAA